MVLRSLADRKYGITSRFVLLASSFRYILDQMHKTTLMLDDAKLRRARRVLGTKGIRDTIDRALDEVLAVDARRRLVEKLRTMKGLDLDNAEVMAGAWR